MITYKSAIRKNVAKIDTHTPKKKLRFNFTFFRKPYLEFSVEVAVRAAFVRLVVGNVPRRKPWIDKGRKEAQIIVVATTEQRRRKAMAPEMATVELRLSPPVSRKEAQEIGFRASSEGDTEKGTTSVREKERDQSTGDGILGMSTYYGEESKALFFGIENTS